MRILHVDVIRIIAMDMPSVFRTHITQLLQSYLQFVFVTGIVATVVYQQGCTVPQQCSTQPAEGNLGSVANSAEDEFSPTQISHTMLYTTSRPRDEDQLLVVNDKIKNAVFEMHHNLDGSFSAPDINRSLPVNMNFGGTPAYAQFTDTTAIIVFAKTIGSGKTANVELYQSTEVNNIWSTPQPITFLNTTAWESQPCLAPDGSYLIFASDRKGGNGGIDLYISLREGTSWSAPQNLGPNINSDDDDITPSIGRKSQLLYASKGFTKNENSNFELYIAERNETGMWNKSRLLPEPFNSAYDDLSPLMWGDSLMFASKRPGGCGGFDLYALGLCGPVFLRGEVKSSPTLTRRGGVVTILDSTGKFAQSSVNEAGTFEVKLIPNRHYILRYVNMCSPQIIEQEFDAPCNELKTVVLTTVIQLPDINPTFTFEEYNVPFFATGYYQPNSSEELNALRLKFDYNLMGTADSTMYIRNPEGQEYDDFAPVIDTALNNAAQFIERALQYRAAGCITNNSKIRVELEGFVDTRPFAATARYAGETINDATFDMFVERGAKMTNNLLSQLRAYYTAKAIERNLMKSTLYQLNKRWVSWHIAGKGTDESDAPDGLKRRVELTIRIQ